MDMFSYKWRDMWAMNPPLLQPKTNKYYPLCVAYTQYVHLFNFRYPNVPTLHCSVQIQVSIGIYGHFHAANKDEWFGVSVWE